MDIAPLIFGLLLVGIAVDILLVGKAPNPNRQQQDEYIFGRWGPRTDFARRRIWWYGGISRAIELRWLSAVLLGTGVALLAKAIGVV